MIRITRSLEKYARTIFSQEDRFSPSEFYLRACKNSSAKTLPSSDDLAYLGLERVKNMLVQKSGTGNSFAAEPGGRRYRLLPSTGVGMLLRTEVEDERSDAADTPPKKIEGRKRAR